MKNLQNSHSSLNSVGSWAQTQINLPNNKTDRQKDRQTHRQKDKQTDKLNTGRWHGY